MLLEIYPPEPELAHLLMHVMVLQLDQIDSHIPAAISPSIMYFLRGSAALRQADGSYLESPDLFLFGPFKQPIRTRYTAGTVCISVCFRPGILHQACGVYPEQVLGQAVPLEQLFDPQKIQQYRQYTARDLPIAEQVRAFQQMLRQVLNLKKRSGMGEAFLEAQNRLFFPLADLSSFFGIGQRQLERRVVQAFGMPIRDVRRFSRYGYSMLHMIANPTGWGDLTHIAQQFGYYDQAHMHRDYIDLTGLPPSQLLQKIASNDPEYWIYRIGPEQFRKLFYVS